MYKPAPSGPSPRAAKIASAARLPDVRIAFVNEWLVTYAGSEKVLAEMLGQYPGAHLYCLLDTSNGRYRSQYLGKCFRTIFLQKLVFLDSVPFFRGFHRYLLPLMPLAMEQLDLSGYDIIISNNHAVAKGIIVGPDQVHICYCYTPMRYAWDLQHQYLREQKFRGVCGALARWLLHAIRLWDLRTSNGVDHFIACSGFIKRRIWRVYRRDAIVVYPGVDTAYYRNGVQKKQEYSVTASRLVPYKKVGLIAEAFAAMPDKTLIIIGDGPQYKAVKAFARYPNISVLGYQPDAALLHYLQGARAFVFAAEEDFGISPLEAQACGIPVLAYGKGGACETVLDGMTGLHFSEQSVASIQDVVRRFEEAEGSFDPLLIRKHAEQFSIDLFRRRFKTVVDQFWRARHVGSEASASEVLIT